MKSISDGIQRGDDIAARARNGLPEEDGRQASAIDTRVSRACFEMLTRAGQRTPEDETEGCRAGERAVSWEVKNRSIGTRGGRTDPDRRRNFHTKPTGTPRWWSLTLGPGDASAVARWRPRQRALTEQRPNAGVWRRAHEARGRGVPASSQARSLLWGPEKSESGLWGAHGIIVSAHGRPAGPPAPFSHRYMNMTLTVHRECRAVSRGWT